MQLQIRESERHLKVEFWRSPGGNGATHEKPQSSYLVSLSIFIREVHLPDVSQKRYSCAYLLDLDN